MLGVGGRSYPRPSLGQEALVAAEMIGAHSGLGFLTLNSQEVFQIPSMYAGILLLAVVGLLLNFLLALLERRFTYWRRGLRHGG